MKKFLFVVFKVMVIFLFLPFCLYASENRKSIAVLGFINTGPKSDDSVNLIIMKSLNTFLAEIQEINLTPFDAVENLANNKKYWESKSVDKDTVLDMGLNLAVSEVVTGDYQIDKKNNTINVNVVVYDPATSELKLKRQYSGAAGMDLFDTIDKMIGNITVQILGHPVTIGRLDIEIASYKDYQLYINSIFQKKMTRDNGYNEIYPADQDTLIELRIPESGRDVYSNAVRVKTGETFNVTYSPAGKIMVHAKGYEGTEVYLNNIVSGNIDTNGFYLLDNLKAGETNAISLKRDGISLGSKQIFVEEGKTTAVDFIYQNPIAKSAGGFRHFYFPINLLEGGLGGEAGFGWYFTDYFRVSVMGGAVYMNNEILPEAEGNVSYSFLKLADFRLWITAAGFSYFTSPMIISPEMKLELSWKSIFIDGGVRYSIDKSAVYPMLSFGIRL